LRKYRANLIVFLEISLKSVPLGLRTPAILVPPSGLKPNSQIPQVQSKSAWLLPMLDGALRGKAAFPPVLFVRNPPANRPNHRENRYNQDDWQHFLQPP
jgi:hypothetical protein